MKFGEVEDAKPEDSRELTREVSINEMLASVANQPNAVDRVAVLERLMAIKEHTEERQARLAFESAFAKMRAQLPAIKKTKEVKTYGGKHMYDYAPLDEIQRACDPILQSHGFSYSWREEAIEGGKRIYFDLFGYGHTKSNFFDAPLLGAQTSNEGKEVTNVVQAARKTSSYAKRNSMVDGLGLIIEDEDDDANLDLTDPELKAVVEKLESADTIEKLLDYNKIALGRYPNAGNERTFILGIYAQARQRLVKAPPQAENKAEK
jgi:hypothetical protein